MHSTDPDFFMWLLGSSSNPDGPRQALYQLSSAPGGSNRFRESQFNFDVIFLLNELKSKTFTVQRFLRYLEIKNKELWVNASTVFWISGRSVHGDTSKDTFVLFLIFGSEFACTCVCVPCGCLQKPEGTRFPATGLTSG